MVFGLAGSIDVKKLAHLGDIYMVVFVKAINSIRTLFLQRLLSVLAAGLLLVGNCITINAAMAEPVRLMVLGDSLVAGYGLPSGQSFPDALGRALAASGHDVETLNAGVSGDTTAGGLARLDWSLAEKPDAVIIVLGGNDMLRGLDPNVTRANLAAIVDGLDQRGIDVLLAGMLAPRNLGDDFVKEFDRIYPDLAAARNIEYYPFFLGGVAMDPALNLADGLHPNVAGISEIVRRILPKVEMLLARTEARRKTASKG
jgi:acyl-CoA thioesterase-1